MRIEKLKVKPRNPNTLQPCLSEFAQLLACYASTNRMMGIPILGLNSNPTPPTPDRMAGNPCAEQQRALEACSRTAGPRARKAPKSTINYHLAKWSKRV